MKTTTSLSFGGVEAPAHMLALCAVLCVAACASAPPIGAQWSDPQLGAHSGLLRGGTVLVACEVQDAAVRQICQQQLSSEVVARGGSPVLAPADLPMAPDRAVDSQLLPSARNAGAKALLVLTLAPAATGVSSGFSVGIGGFGLGRNSAIGGGVTAPIGGGRVETGFAANGRVTDAGSGKLVWTASASAAPSADLSAQCAALSKALLDSAKKTGLF